MTYLHGFIGAYLLLPCCLCPVAGVLALFSFSLISLFLVAKVPWDVGGLGPNQRGARSAYTRKSCVVRTCACEEPPGLESGIWSLLMLDAATLGCILLFLRVRRNYAVSA